MASPFSPTVAFDSPDCSSFLSVIGKKDCALGTENYMTAKREGNFNLLKRKNADMSTLNFMFSTFSFDPRGLENYTLNFDNR
ncbi:hypothetical protein E2320_015611, partial [Naja naja]